uniref:DUF4806 domain-containing protein n=1 Tax=Caenorhabditis tropicalis TaxID=1561998 RepID=A0A1I7TPM8_9PELO
MPATFANAGLYTMTLEAMLLSPAAEKKDEKKAFQDEILLKKTKSVSRLVEKYETGQLDETIGEALERMSLEPCHVAPTPKPRTNQDSDEISRNLEDPVAPESSSKVILETPILKKSAPKPLNTEILDSKPTKIEPLRPYYSPLRSNDSILVRQEQMRVKKGSICLSSNDSPPSEPSTSSSHSSGFSLSNTDEMEMNIYHKLARAQIHNTFPKYYSWNTETLRTISEHVSSIRLEALEGAPKDSKTRIMMTIYQKCVNGKVTKEMDALTATIFDLMDTNVHEKKISVFEEYVVAKYSKKLFS